MVTQAHKHISYQTLFWLFITGSLFGVLLEGTFCYFNYGHWETHVVSIWGPFCILYGIAASLFYSGSAIMEGKGKIFKFACFAILADIVEYASGALLKYGLEMRAWNYEADFMNFDGLICLKMTIVWGLAGLIFSEYLFPKINILKGKFHSKKWRIACTALSTFMLINLSLTFMCIDRWAERHAEVPAQNRFDRIIDARYGDELMQSRFCEWSFIEKQ